MDEVRIWTVGRSADEIVHHDGPDPRRQRVRAWRPTGGSTKRTARWRSTKARRTGTCPSGPMRPSRRGSCPNAPLGRSGLVIVPDAPADPGSWSADEIALAWTVTNTGRGAANSLWTDAVFLSTQATWDRTALWLADGVRLDASPLGSGESYSLLRSVRAASPRDVPTFCLSPTGGTSRARPTSPTTCLPRPSTSGRALPDLLR